MEQMKTAYGGVGGVGELWEIKTRPIAFLL